MNKKLQDMVLASIFIALIIMMTVVPFTGYITYGPVEITTLHIVVILGAVILGPKYGTALGAVWGITCFIRAFTNPLFIMFTNPLISILPRILVGFVAGIISKYLFKTKLPKSLGAIITAVAGTLTNTVLVLSAIYVFGGMIKSYAEFFEMFKTIYVTIIGTNGLIELIAAIIIIPVVYKVIEHIQKKNLAK